MLAIPCKYSVPYRAYPNLYVAASANAYATFLVSPGWDIALYEQFNVEGLSRLFLEFTEYVNDGLQIVRQFTFWNSALGGGAPVGFGIDVAGLVTAADLANAIQAAIAANTGMIVQYSPGSPSFTMSQPFPGSAPLTFPITWSMFNQGSGLIGPCHPSGISINGQYAPSQTVLPRSTSEVDIDIPAGGFVAADLVGLVIDIPVYTGVGDNPYDNASMRFVAAAGPVLPGVAYVVIDQPFSNAQVAGLMALAFQALGFDISPVVGSTFTASQPLYGPGGNTFPAISGTATDPDQIVWNGLALSNQPNAFDGGVGSNLFAFDSGVYGGNTTPLRFGKNYGMLPLAAPPTPQG